MEQKNYEKVSKSQWKKKYTQCQTTIHSQAKRLEQIEIRNI